MSPSLSLRGLVEAGRVALAASPSARLDAEVLLAHCLQKPRTWLYSHADDEPDEAVRNGYAALLERRVAGEPVAYLTGQREFWNLALSVNAATLIPRPATEALVAAALRRLAGRTAPAVADLGTGSGAIALALAAERRDATLFATDASADALAVAQANALRLGIDNVRFAQGDWLQALPAGARFDMLVSNPPYIAEGDPHLGAGDVRYEPRTALVSGADGLDALRALSAAAPQRLRSDGWLLLEHGAAQGPAVRELLREAQLIEVATLADLAGQPRVTLGRRGAD